MQSAATVIDWLKGRIDLLDEANQRISEALEELQVCLDEYKKMGIAASLKSVNDEIDEVNARIESFDDGVAMAGKLNHLGTILE